MPLGGYEGFSFLQGIDATLDPNHSSEAPAVEGVLGIHSSHITRGLTEAGQEGPHAPSMDTTTMRLIAVMGTPPNTSTEPKMAASNGIKQPSGPLTKVSTMDLRG